MSPPILSHGLRLRQTLLLAGALVVLSLPGFAWPTTSQWLPVYRQGSILQDPNGDASASKNVVSDATHAAGFIFNDGTYIYFRMRLDTDPGHGGQGVLRPYGWAIEFDTNNNAGDYEWLLMVDGISQTETVALWQNTVQGTLGDPSDMPEIMQYSMALSGNYQITAADTAFNGDTDYFLDWRFPYATLKQYTGLTDSSPLRLFEGSSSSASRLSQSGGDLVGPADLLAGFSDFITPFGTRPTTGTVRFVAALAGSGDVTQITAGDTIYVRVDDLDQNHNPTAADTVAVGLASVNGDNEQITLTETGANTGVFTGSITTSTAAVVVNNGSLQVVVGTMVTVTYVDAIAANLQQNQVRTDTLTVRTPQILITKSVDKATAAPGETLTYKVYYRNLGTALATAVVISDSIPANTTYVPNSLRIGTASATYATATPKTDTDADTDGAQVSGTAVMFIINSVAPDDGVPNSGPDEGVVFFRVTIN